MAPSRNPRRKLRQPKVSKNDDRLKCPGCKNRFSSNAEFTKHIKYSTGKCAQPKSVLKCVHCKNEFSTKKALENHIRMNPYCSALNDPQKLGKLRYIVPQESSSKQNTSLSHQHNSSTSINESSSLYPKKRRSNYETPPSCFEQSSSKIVNSHMCYPTNLQNKNTYPVKQNSVSVDELRDLSFHMRSKCCSINDALEMLMKVASISDV